MYTSIKAYTQRTDNRRQRVRKELGYHGVTDHAITYYIRPISRRYRYTYYKRRSAGPFSGSQPNSNMYLNV